MGRVGKILMPVRFYILFVASGQSQQATPSYRYALAVEEIFCMMALLFPARIKHLLYLNKKNWRKTKGTIETHCSLETSTLYLGRRTGMLCVNVGRAVSSAIGAFVHAFVKWNWSLWSWGKSANVLFLWLNALKNSAIVWSKNRDRGVKKEKDYKATNICHAVWFLYVVLSDAWVFPHCAGSEEFPHCDSPADDAIIWSQ